MGIFVALFLTTLLLGETRQVQILGLMIQDALQQVRPGGHALYCRFVAIDDDDFRAIFRGQTPLRPATVNEIIHDLLRFHPAVLAIDLDTSDSSFAEFAFVEKADTIVWARDMQGDPSAISGRPEVEPPRSGIASSYLDIDGKFRILDKTIPYGSRDLPTFYWAVVNRYCSRLPHLDGVPGCAPTSLLDSKPIQPRFRERPELDPIWIRDIQRADPHQRNMLSGKVVILGGARRARDFQLTPLGPMPGARIAAEAIEAELQGDLIHESPWWLKWAIKLILGILIIVFNHRLKPVPGLIASMLLGLIIFVSGISFFYLGAFWMDITAFCTAVFIEQMVEQAVEAQHDSANSA